MGRRGSAAAGHTPIQSDGYRVLTANASARKTDKLWAMDVYLFGAGASAAEGAPATWDFFAQAWQRLAPDFDERVQNVWRFLTDIFGVAVEGPDSFAYIPAMDQVFSLVDWSLHVDQALGARYDPPRLYQVRRDLEHLLCATLDAALEQRERRAGGPHASFVRRILAEKGTAGFALLSLNYDTLLDDALVDAGASPDYGFADLDLRRRHRPLLAKLHGSLNWALCKACDHVQAADGKIAHLLPHVEGLSCCRCGNERLHSMIVSPTWLKSYDTPQLRHVWDLALECIQQAQRIVFVGYSMPPADLAIHQLIRRGMLTRRTLAPPRLEVINHSQEITEHFHRLLGPEIYFDISGFHGQI